MNRIMKTTTPKHLRQRQRGSAMLEFAVIGPVISLIGMGILQYGMLFFAKNHINHASFMAARAGSLGNANIGTVQAAYTRALVPLYGGGLTATELAEAYGKAAADVATSTRIELLNPTKESFDDWNAPKLQALLNTGSKRVIPNGNLAYKSQNIGGTSGQSLADANMIKIRITQGYEPKVPLMRTIYTKYLQWLDPKTDAFHTSMVQAGRIPVVSHITLQMQSDAIEGSPVSLPGAGNNGHPTNPGEPPTTPTDQPPPRCDTAGCSTEHVPDDGHPPGDTDPNNPCDGTNCCPFPG